MNDDAANLLRVMKSYLMHVSHVRLICAQRIHLVQQTHRRVVEETSNDCRSLDQPEHHISRLRSQIFAISRFNLPYLRKRRL
jgi:hypothetical protein